MSRRTIVLGFALLLAAFATSFITTHESLMQALWNEVRLIEGGVKSLRDYFLYQDKQFPDSTPRDGETYDFVIIGAGSAGATIASRLSEIRHAKVLLIEAGGEEDLIMDVPLLALLMQLNKAINWGYEEEANSRYCQSVIRGQCRCARGRVMGGTSTMNFMIATRGTRNDYDEWAALTGDQSWGYDGMLKYFKKLEKFDVTLANVDEAYHGFDGPVRIANPPYVSPLAQAFVKAGMELGFPQTDYNGRKVTGFAYMQTNQENGERVTTNRAYLLPIRDRRNLKVTMFSHVNRILIDPYTKTAYGVEFEKFGRTIKVRAKKEVILSAGAIASPQILMLSGIGPAQHLRQFGIKVLQDLPVGQSMKDHISYGGLVFFINETSSVVSPELINPLNPTISDYMAKRTGPITTAGGTEGLGYINVDNPTSYDENPNIELLFTTAGLTTDILIHKTFGMSDYYWQRFLSDKLYKHAWAIFPLLMKPKSMGQLLLRSTDPKDKPRILSNYLSHPDDIRVAIKGIRWAIKVSKTQAMQRFGSRLHDRVVPGCESYVPDSDNYWECALRTFTMTYWHQCSTCKMGRENDPTAVVNTRLQVKGIKRLRVADTSIMPNIVTAHTNIPTIAIAEKFSDIVKRDYGYI